MAHLRLSVHVAASPQETFDLFTNLDRMHEWVGGVTAVTDVTGPVDQIGTRYTTWFGKMSSPTVVVAADPAHLFRTSFGNRILRGEAQATFEPEGDGTMLVQEFWTHGLISAVLGRLFAIGSWKGSFQGELNTFARIAGAQHKAEA